MTAAQRSLRSFSLLLTLVSLFLLPALLLSASTDKPQGHTGIVKPFKPGPPGIKLKSGEIEKLRKGEAVKQQLSSGSGGRGLVIQDVHAPPEVVWGRIMDFPAYTRMVPRVSLCENYKMQENYMQGLKEIYTRMRLTVMGFNVEYFIHHKYYPKMNTIVWTLDYNREVRSGVGYPLYLSLSPTLCIHTCGYIDRWVDKFIYRERERDGEREREREIGIFGAGLRHLRFINPPILTFLPLSLPPSLQSDLDDSVGYWHVIPHPDPDREHWSRVYYSIDMRLKSWMPSFVKNVLKNQVGQPALTSSFPHSLHSLHSNCF